MATRTLDETWSVDANQFPYAGDAHCRFEFLLRYAILAPSSHNSQPWLFDVTPDHIDLYMDPTRALPVVDPDNRELIISCGAALEFLCVSARNFGYEPRVDMDNEWQIPDFLARFSLSSRCKPQPNDVALFEAIPKRRTNRLKYKPRRVPETIVKEIEMAAQDFGVYLDAFAADADRKDIARMVGEADKIQASDAKFRRELASWIHFNRSLSRDGMPGYAHGAGDLKSVIGPLVVRTFDWGKGQAAKDEQLAVGSPLLAILKTVNDTPQDWINTGRALARVLLTLTHHGLSASYLNQPIEVGDLRSALISKLGGVCEPQILLRIGYGAQTKPTPRRTTAEVIIQR